MKPMGVWRMAQARYLYGVRKLLRNTNACDCQAHEMQLIADPKHSWSTLVFSVCFVLALLVVMVRGCDYAQASTLEIGYSDTAIVNAIYIIEGGAKTKWPYGILTKYKHTSPRQACFNTVAHKRRDWLKAGRSGSFLAYLAGRYAPLNASNDPTGLNRNWERNLRAVLTKGGANG